MGDATKPSCNEVSDAETGACINGAGTMDDNGLGGAESKVNIVAKEKQIDINSEIYYIMYSSKNRTPTISDKTNKILILISSSLMYDCLSKLTM